ncbi:TlpA family protein disulfide reductase [Ekhidna sp.]|uniref:TlpA family protein disulfide reductase n=1 Tax=Ekhidna sp. TaxID=2608089 RepID=UPI0035185735
MKHKIKKELVEWIVLLVVIGVIYFGGWHTEVIGRIQQVVLATGIISPDIVDEEKKASYDFWIEDLEGNRVNFAQMENQVVFLNFWATWCPPCIAEMPDIHSLYKEKKDEVAFVMISLDQDEEKARKFIAKKDFEFPVYFLRSSLPSVYDTHSIPTTYLIDKEGMIRVENHGMAKYNTSSFKELLDQLSEFEQAM